MTLSALEQPLGDSASKNPVLDTAAVARAAECADVLRRLASPPFPATLTALGEEIGRADLSNFRKVLKSLESAGLISGMAEGVEALALTEAGAQALRGLEVATGASELDPDARLIPWNRLSLNPLNPRKTIVAQEIEDLAANIHAELTAGRRGLLQNLVVYPAGADGKHFLSAGEKRWRAIALLVEREVVPDTFLVPCSEREMDPAQEAAQVAIVALSENLQRSNLSLIEEARAYLTIEQSTGWGPTEIARRVGRDPKTVQEMLKVLHEARPEHIAAHEAGEPEWKWEALRESVKTLKLTPQQALIVVEFYAASRSAGDDSDEGGPGCIDVAFIPSFGPTDELRSRGFIEFGGSDDAPVARLRADNPKLSAWLEVAIGPGDDDQVDAALFTARAAVVGSFEARNLEETGRYATEWLNARPDDDLEDPAPPPSDDDQGALDGATGAPGGTGAAGPAAADARPLSPVEEADEVARKAAEAARSSTPAKPCTPTAEQRLILVEIAHKIRAAPVAIPQGETGAKSGCAITAETPELVAIAHEGWISRHLPDTDVRAVCLTEIGVRMIAPNGLAMVDLDALLQLARKEAGLSSGKRLQLQQEGVYAFPPLNTAAPKRDHAVLDEVSERALAEVAAKIEADGVEPAGKGFRGCETFDYWRSYAAQKLLKEKLVAFTTHNSVWLATVTAIGRAWLDARGWTPEKLADLAARPWMTDFLAPPAPETQRALGPQRDEPAPQSKVESAEGTTESIEAVHFRLTDAHPAVWKDPHGAERRFGDGWVVLKVTEALRLQRELEAAE